MKRSDKLAQLLTAILADFGASWKFIFLFFVFIAAWIVWNVAPETKAYHFDEFPFIFLNLAMSFLAAIQAPVIIMAANHAARKDRKELHEIHKILEELKNDKY